jgi:hypothetical protein
LCNRELKRSPDSFLRSGEIIEREDRSWSGDDKTLREIIMGRKRQSTKKSVGREYNRGKKQQQTKRHVSNERDLES